jgi:uncharacterized protein YbjT (DUF2867 family)
METRIVFLSGGTGYLGRPLTELLLANGHEVRVLARKGSEVKVPQGARAIPGNALDASTFEAGARGADTFVHLTGTPHPAPWKENQFRAIDLVSLTASTEAALRVGIRHFVYVSVAHPAPVMRSYIQVRTECEEILARSGMSHTILRPWYVLGPGHWWPWGLKPLYALAERAPKWRAGARRLGLVTQGEMVRALAWATHNPPTRGRVLEVPEIRRSGATEPGA